MPGGRQDSVPEQKPASTAPAVSSHGALPEPSLAGRSDAIAAAAVEGHLARHAASRIGRGE
jgi:hypothetical protein